MPAARSLSDALRDAQELQRNFGAMAQGLRDIAGQCDKLQRQAGAVAYALSRALADMHHEAPPLAHVPDGTTAACHGFATDAGAAEFIRDLEADYRAAPGTFFHGRIGLDTDSEGGSHD